MTTPVSPATPFRGLILDLAITALVVACVVAVSGLRPRSHATCPHAATHAIVVSPPTP